MNIPRADGNSNRMSAVGSGAHRRCCSCNSFSLMVLKMRTSSADDEHAAENPERMNAPRPAESE
jgi:hypothetical protein